MTWNHRVMRTTEGAGESFAIDEVYDADAGGPEARTEAPVHTALREPVLDEDCWPEA